MIGELNIYSCYSFQNSTILIKDLCKRAHDLHLEAIALTDINNMYGAVEFSNECHKYDIKPIFGMQGNVNVEGEIYPIWLCLRKCLRIIIIFVSKIMASKCKNT